MSSRFFHLCAPLFENYINFVGCYVNPAHMKNNTFLFIFPLFFCFPVNAQPLLNKLPASRTGVDFMNKITETEDQNVMSYEYYFNGGGVAVGDLNNDGLPDLYFSANMESNQLFLNKGNLHFENITKSAGVKGRKGWKTGVCMTDVNADGWLDIYVCYSGKGNPEFRRNQLFINNHNLTFTDQAKAYGLDDPGYGTQAAFFDFDQDGDLDCFLLNHNIEEFRNFENDSLRLVRDPYAGDKLFENKKGKFIDISEKAGILANPLGFGLGLGVSDLNDDGWMDIYVSNDYNEPDYLYINNKNGTFSEKIKESMGHISQFSMGNDMADFNNDALIDVITLDMLPEDNRRQKLLQGPDNYEVYQRMVETGLHCQFMRNMLQLNNGDGTFSEIGQLAGVSNTDWSWSPLFADLDNDGWKDLIITNGYMRDYTNRDFLKYWGDYLVKKAVNGETPSLLELVKAIPVTLISNYVFKNNGNLTFTDKTKEWGFNYPVLSNGAAYADLDNDGDLDLIINNINEPASIYQNTTQDVSPKHYVNIKLSGEGGNTFGIGAKIRVDGKPNQLYEQMPVRGYQSSVSEIIHIGLGDDTTAYFNVIWPNGQVIEYGYQKDEHFLDFRQKECRAIELPWANDRPESLFQKDTNTIHASHTEYEYNDFKRQPLMPQMISHCGPTMAKGDINGDGWEDLYIGGSKWGSRDVYLQKEDGHFEPMHQEVFADDQFNTDADAIFFDADGDGDSDLYVVSGGYEDYRENDPLMQDRLFLNDGKGVFNRRDSLLPPMISSKSCVAASDFDADGDIDLFVGGRVIPGKYPLAPRSYLLENDGKGGFRDVTAEKAPDLLHPGMITDAKWADLNGDGKPELLICGEWMPIRVFDFIQGKLSDQTNHFFKKNESGFWNKLFLADIDQDGDLDLIAGNLGTNSQIKASEKEPATLVYKDFDGNGSVDPFLCFYNQGHSYPFVNRDELLDQLYSKRSVFTSYDSYANATLDQILLPVELSGADTLQAVHLQNSCFLNEKGTFVEIPLPPEAQFSPVYAIAQVKHNDTLGIVLAGNQSAARLRLGKSDANYGQFFIWEDGKWKYQTDSGFQVKGDVRAIEVVKTSKGDRIIFGINNNKVVVYKSKLHDE